MGNGCLTEEHIKELVRILDKILTEHFNRYAARQGQCCIASFYLFCLSFDLCFFVPLFLFFDTACLFNSCLHYAKALHCHVIDLPTLDYLSCSVRLLAVALVVLQHSFLFHNLEPSVSRWLVLHMAEQTVFDVTCRYFPSFFTDTKM